MSVLINGLGGNKKGSSGGRSMVIVNSSSKGASRGLTHGLEGHEYFTRSALTERASIRSSCWIRLAVIKHYDINRRIQGSSSSAFTRLLLGISRRGGFVIMSNLRSSSFLRI